MVLTPQPPRTTEAARRTLARGGGDAQPEARHHNLSVYSRWLAEKLERMVNDRLRANRIREFLQAFEAKLPNKVRDNKTVEWIAAVADFADRLDPLTRPERVARPIEMSDDELAKFVERLEKESAPEQQTGAGQKRAGPGV